MANKIKKTRFIVEIELDDNVELLYPNYRYNFANRGQFINMIKREITNIVYPQNGTKITIHKL